MKKNFDEKDAGSLKTIIIAVHGFASSKNSFVISKIATKLIENNIGLVCFDLPGHGDRKNEVFTIPACLESIRKVENYVRSFYSGTIGFTGASLGGFLLLRYLDDNQNKYGKIILRSPALSQYDVWVKDVSENGRELIKGLESGRNYFLNSMEVDVSVLDDYFKFDIFNHLNINQDVKLMYATKDITISNKNIKKLAKIKGWDVFPLKCADHFCRRDEDIENIANLFLKIINDN